MVSCTSYNYITTIIIIILIITIFILQFIKTKCPDCPSCPKTETCKTCNNTGNVSALSTTISAISAPLRIINPLITVNKDFMLLGYIQSTLDSSKKYQLYGRNKDGYNKYKFEYYYVDSSQFDSKIMVTFSSLNDKELYDGDLVNIDGTDFKAIIYPIDNKSFGSYPINS